MRRFTRTRWPRASRATSPTAPTSTSASAADAGGQPPAEGPRDRPAHRERPLGMGPSPPPGRRILGPHQRRQAAGDRAAGRIVLPSRRLVRDDARRPPRLCVLGAFRSPRTATSPNWHTGAPDAIPRWAARWTSRSARKRLRDDGAPDEAGPADRRAVHVSRHGPRVRRSHLHRPRGDRRGAGPRRHRHRAGLAFADALRASPACR